MHHPRSGAVDTDPAIDDLLVAAYRRMSSEDKMRRVLDCNATAEAMAMAGLQARFGAIGERELRFHLAALRLGRATMIEAFGWDPEQTGQHG